MLPAPFHHPDLGTSIHLDMTLGEGNAIPDRSPLSHQLYTLGKSQTFGNHRVTSAAALLSLRLYTEVEM